MKADGPRFQLVSRWHNTTVTSWGPTDGLPLTASSDQRGGALAIVDVGFSHMTSPWKSVSQRVEEWLKKAGLSARRVLKGPMSLTKQLEYKLLLSVEGFDVASDLKWKLLSQSVVLMPLPTRSTWLMEPLLQAWTHFIPVRDDFEDLPERVMWALAHPEACKLISWHATMWVEQLFYDIAELPKRWLLPKISSNGEPSPNALGYSEEANRFPANEEVIGSRVLAAVLLSTTVLLSE